MNNPSGGGASDPPSIPPPPPPPPPLNIPPSRARLQLAARLAMHQKTTGSSHSPSGFDHDGNEDDDEDDGLDPFGDGEEEDLDDDDLDEDQDAGQSRGSWWRNVVGGGGGGDNSGPDSEDDEEFGDFAMAEPEKPKDDQSEESAAETSEKGLFRPLAVNPAKEAARGLSGLWPFGTKKKETEESEDEVVVSPVDGEEDGHHIEEVKQAVMRTSLEDEEEIVIGLDLSRA